MTLEARRDGTERAQGVKLPEHAKEKLAARAEDPNARRVVAVF